MNIKRFIAPTVRQALKDIRNELGDEAVILSNRKTSEGVEIVALANETMTQLAESIANRHDASSAPKHESAGDSRFHQLTSPPQAANPHTSPDGTTSHSAKSASGQAAGYLPQGNGTNESQREFQAKPPSNTRVANRHGANVAPNHESACASRLPHPILPPVGEGENETLRDFHGNESPREFQADARKGHAAGAGTAQPMSGNDNILVEIKSMHSMLQHLAELSWSHVQQRDPQRSSLLRKMLNSGFSTLLARQLLEKMPADKKQGEFWAKQVLKRNLHMAGEANDFIAKGGVYALIGPTGVGKTTTTAKLAARAVVRYGADSVALLTTDGYRIGAYEQLRIYGRILGVAVHAVKDTDDLCLTLSTLRRKHLVLIDTLGMGQRDVRVCDQSEMLNAAGVERLLLLNATSCSGTLEDVVRMYHIDKTIGCIITKLDEAINLGAVLDVVVRHRAVMHYMTNGQRVPEDMHRINLDYLLHRAFKAAETKTPFTIDELEFPAMMAAGADSSRRVAPCAL